MLSETAKRQFTTFELALMDVSADTLIQEYNRYVARVNNLTLTYIESKELQQVQFIMLRRGLDRYWKF